MERWSVEDRLEITLEDLREARIRIVAGEVAVTAGPGPARLEVAKVEGPPVKVRYGDGVLRIRHGDNDGSGLERLLGLLSGKRCEAVVTLTAPPEMLCEIGVVSAAVVVSGMTTGADVKSVSGDVTLDGIGERLDINTVSGDVEARAISADIKAKTVSGSMTLVDGSSRWVETRTVSGDVMLDLDLHPAGHYDVVTVSGDVALRAGGEPSFVVEANSVSGSVRSEFGLDWESNRPGRRRLRATIGAGDARLNVKTVSGDLRLVRRREAAA